jgi:hypothetical protein
MSAPFQSHRDAALALLQKNEGLNWKAGGFCGQLCVSESPLSPAQRDWLGKLLSRAELPPLAEEATHG